MLEGKRSVFLETKQKKKKLANLESCKRSSGQEYIHLMVSLGNLPNCYQSTATKLLFLKAAFQRVFIPIASEERVLILLPIMYD